MADPNGEQGLREALERIKNTAIPNATYPQEELNTIRELADAALASTPPERCPTESDRRREMAERVFPGEGGTASILPSAESVLPTPPESEPGTEPWRDRAERTDG